VKRGIITLVCSGVATRLLATAIAVFGLYITPISWQLALLVYGWALVELLITDPLKILVYRVLDHSGVRFRSQGWLGGSL